MTIESMKSNRSEATLTGAQAFIETQFPVSKASKESYKERKAVAGQTLTALGKWWGRKPLVLVRAALLGLLMPASDDPQKDRETFLALMTMDEDGLLHRLKGPISASSVYTHSTEHERKTYFDMKNGKPTWKKDLPQDERRRLQRLAFHRMGYDEKLQYCLRPEEVDGPLQDTWERINTHLGTNASSLPELVAELGIRRFGHIPRVGDAFCGAGNIPYEAARIGCEAYGSDLSPVGALLTWGAMNIVGGGKQAVEQVTETQRRIYAAVECQVDEWGIERNEQGWVAEAYLYCNEVVDPATGWHVPLAPSWVIASKPNVIAQLIPDPSNKRFDIEILEGVTNEEAARAAEEGTAKGGVCSPVDQNGNWLRPHQRQTISFETLRGRHGLRLWENEDVAPRSGDVFQERLYCIRWIDPETGKRHYRAPTEADLAREEQVLSLLRERFAEWQAKGYIPSRRIEPGDKTDEPIKTRGWTHWHHLFNPRQLLLNGLFAEAATRESGLDGLAALLLIGRVADANARLTRWLVGQGGGIGGPKNVFYNQALNTLVNYACRTMRTFESNVCIGFEPSLINGGWQALPRDARAVDWTADIWITDPGYADAINYEELSEFFLAWYEKQLQNVFPDWYMDSKRALAVKGTGEEFRQSMLECYRRLASLMPEDGLQVVMFTHQDAEVWADLALILWAAGLQVTAAWTIATETEAAGLKQGNYVQGTVLLVLRKRKEDKRGDLSDLYPDIQAEVQSQLDSMLALDPKEDRNFSDADYQLAAYAAALRVLTGYGSIAEIDVERELVRPSNRSNTSPLAQLIERAVKIASDYLVPDGLDRNVWRRLSPEERLYIKGVEVENHEEYRQGVYQEFARGYGAQDYQMLLATGGANETCLKTPSDFAGRDLGPGDNDFTGSLLRLVLFSIYLTARDGDPRPGREYLRQELADYWSSRQTIIGLLQFLANMPSPTMTRWAKDVEAADLLLGMVENDSV